MTWLTLALATTAPSAACGGFGCDLYQFVPVFQNAERIVFAQDEGTVEMHVQITYEGEADQFAWIVPVPAAPDVFVTTDQLFQQLQQALPMFFNLNTTVEGTCKGRGKGLFAGNVDATSADTGSYGFTPPSAPTTTVQVLAQQNVGPYETVTLQAESVEGLMGWLTANGYAFQDGAEASIAPYVGQEGATFLALRLQKDRTWATSPRSRSASPQQRRASRSSSPPCRRRRTCGWRSTSSARRAPCRRRTSTSR